MLLAGRERCFAIPPRDAGVTGAYDAAVDFIGFFSSSRGCGAGNAPPWYSDCDGRFFRRQSRIAKDDPWLDAATACSTAAGNTKEH